MKSCKNCTSQFEITSEDKEILKRCNVPEPTLCPDCRHQRRLAFRNERTLYKRKCDFTGKDIISIYSPDCIAPVYSPEIWWGDDWDPLEHGQDIDFTKPFLLQKKVPLLASMVFNSENCEYNNFTVESRNSYGNVRLASCEDVYHCYLTFYCERMFDCYNSGHSQDCYECIDSTNCNNCFFCQLCKNSSNCMYCYDMIGCHDCFGCIKLRNAQYHFFNEKLTKEEYEKKVKEFMDKLDDPTDYRKKFYNEVVVKKPVRSNIFVNTENSTGNYIFESKNIYEGFDIEKTDTCRYGWANEMSKDIFDSDYIYFGENCYENMSNSKSQNIMFSSVAIESCYDLLYSMLCCNNTHDCFGCVSLKHKSYCILNKQYTKEEYLKLKEKLIAHMKETGEWGEFFPMEMSFFAYSETVAQEYFPMTKEEAISKNLKWRDKDKKDYKPAHGDILACSDCGKNYKLVEQELNFYKKHALPVPQKCPDCRHTERVSLRTPRTL